MADFFKNRNMLVNTALRDDVLFLKIVGISHENGNTQLIIKKTTLDIAGIGNTCSRIEADNITGSDAEGFNAFFVVDILIQDNFHCIEGSLCIIVFAVDMDRGIDQLESTIIDSAAAGIDTAIFTLCIVGI